MTDPTCGVPGCEKAPRSPRAELCPMHYHRWYRHGSVDKVATGVRTGKGRRYRFISAKGHPMATASGRAYEHRVVLYDLIGPGPHECYWCGTSVEWGPRGAPDELQPDHLNNDGGDNRPENLVPSCRRCNTGRGSQARADALRSMGWWSSNDTIASCAVQMRKPRVA